jgi:hypothetical protein
VIAEHIPPTVKERAGLYRSVRAEITEPVLVIADNASTGAQVKPLHPGTGPRQVLVTSCNTLGGLDAAWSMSPSSTSGEDARRAGSAWDPGPGIGHHHNVLSQNSRAGERLCHPIVSQSRHQRLAYRSPAAASAGLRRVAVVATVAAGNSTIVIVIVIAVIVVIATRATKTGYAPQVAWIFFKNIDDLLLQDGSIGRIVGWDPKGINPNLTVDVDGPAPLIERFPVGNRGVSSRSPADDRNVRHWVLLYRM